jgi:type IV pilus assembly protein PilC
MPLFTFNARDLSGRPQQGTLNAATAAAVVDNLRGRGWLVLQVQPAAAAGTGNLPRLPAWLVRQPKSVDIELCLQQLATMIRAGLTLLDALSTLAKQTRRAGTRQVWQRVVNDLQEGSSLAEALAKHRCFPPFVIQLMRIGEQTGQLERVLTQSAEAMENRRHLRSSLMTALLYPSIVLAAALGVTAFMMLHVIPKLQVFLKALGKKLPAMTQVLLDVSDLCQAYWLYVLVGTVLVAGGTVAVYCWPPGRLLIDRSLLRLPVIGVLLRVSATAAFAHGLSVLLSSGITLLEALRTVERLHRNHCLARQVAHAREAVMRGGNLANALATQHTFMPLLSSMVAVGEASGMLDDVLGEAARFHELQLKSILKRLSILIEPAITIVVGGIVGYVYISFFLALFAAGS